MKKHIMDEKTGISYTLYGDYYLPDLELKEQEEALQREFKLKKFYSYTDKCQKTMKIISVEELKAKGLLSIIKLS